MRVRHDLSMGLLRPGMDVAALASAELTYAERGATRGELPSGYHHVHRQACIGTGSSTFYRAVDALNRWQMHRRAGFVLLSAPPVADLDAVVVMRLGPPVIGVVVPCRVVYIVDEPDRGGFAYGTLPGNPESGEEAFVVAIGKDRRVELRIHAFSRPASRLARVGGPVTHMVQDLITDSYIRALRHLSQPEPNDPA